MKAHIILLPFILLTTWAHAQFGPQIEISKSTASPVDAKTIDMDGDGDLDVFLTSEDDDKIAWFENLGNGNFSTLQIISISGGHPILSDVADFDGDGDLDVVTAFYYDKISWYKNEGDGSFGAEQIIANPDHPKYLYISDIDGDGDPDLLSTSTHDNYYSNGSKISWYENNGNGFGAEQIISTDVRGQTSLFAADLDGDGDNDVLSASEYQGKIAWYENIGNGSFSSQQVLTTCWDDAHMVCAADMDGDGDLDVVASGEDYYIVWYENIGNGIFEAPEPILDNATGTEKLFTSDLDGDGDLDVLASNQFNTKMVWSENLGSGNFGAKQIIDDSYTYSTMVSGDMDGDGDMDILATDRDASQVVWYENSGTGTFGSATELSASVVSPNFIHPDDLDGDGDIDILVATWGATNMSWYENDGEGNFGDQRIISTNAGMANCVYTADLDGDGDRDVISASMDPGKIAWYENLGNGNFGAQQVISTLVMSPYSVYAGDLDGDGDMDLLSASLVDDKIAWYENLGDGVFNTQHLISVFEDGAHSVCATDIDGDGDLDVLVGSVYGGSGGEIVTWYANDGNANFGNKHTIIADWARAEAVYPADLDGDGDIDVLSGLRGNSGYSDRIVWNQNLGNGDFGDQQIITTDIESPSQVYAADLDNDGDLDLLSSSISDYKIAWYENFGDGTFGPQQILSSDAAFATAVSAADLDGDGDLDVLSASVNNAKIEWYQNYFYHPVQIRGRVFYDINQNGVNDSTDIGFTQVGIYSIPQSDFTFTYSNGNYFMNLSATVGTYQIVPESLFLWDLVTDSLSYTISIDSNFTYIDSVDFGYYPAAIVTEIQPDLTGGFPRCSNIINYWISIENQGTSLPAGILELQLDDSVSYVSSGVEPDSIVGQNIYWRFDTLYYYSSTAINLQVQMPDLNSMGDTLCSILSVYERDDANTTIYENSDTLNQILTCAYDPNDKSVNPIGIGAEGYIAQDQELEYLIRFQNTGNDTAYSVTIKDQLDSDLNKITINPIASSHPMQIHVKQNGEIEFKFENIMLPDSNVDFLGSQGYLKFRVHPKTDLLPNTPITNTARIYFDQNPPIFTNSVLNTIECYNIPQPVITYFSPYLNAGVSGEYSYQWYYNGTEIPGAIGDTLSPFGNGDYSVVITDIYNCTKESEAYTYLYVGIEEIARLNPVVFPNPFNESTSILFSENLNGDYDLLVFNILGQQVYRLNKIEGNEIILFKRELGSGIFLSYIVNNRTGEKIYVEKLVVM